MTTSMLGGLDFSAKGGKRQEREVSQSLQVEPGARHPAWKTQSFEPSLHHSSGSIISLTCLNDNLFRSCLFNLGKLQAQNTIV